MILLYSICLSRVLSLSLPRQNYHTVVVVVEKKEKVKQAFSHQVNLVSGSRMEDLLNIHIPAPS